MDRTQEQRGAVLDRFATELEGRPAADVLRWAVERYAPRLTFAPPRGSSSWDAKVRDREDQPARPLDETGLWRHIVEHDVPYNPLHDLGYPSIGCHPCTSPVRAGEDARAGRWRGRAKTECGLHGPATALR